MVWLHLPIYQIIINFLQAALDIFVITIVFYVFYQILAQTKAVQVIRGFFLFVFFYLISRLLSLTTFSWLLDKIAEVVVIAIIILFQPELRRVLIKIGQSKWMSSFIRKDPKIITNIINAVQNFQILHTGSLIVFERNVGLRNIIESGTLLNAKVSTSLLLTIFSKKAPLHDGAIIIKDDVILAAGCFLPLSDSDQIKKDYGTRHRAALGISEDSDAVVIVVSEETGKISLAYDGKLYTNYDIDLLKKELMVLLEYEEELINEDIINEEI